MKRRDFLKALYLGPWLPFGRLQDWFIVKSKEWPVCDSIPDMTSATVEEGTVLTPEDLRRAMVLLGNHQFPSGDERGIIVPSAQCERAHELYCRGDAEQREILGSLLWCLKHSQPLPEVI